MTFVAKKIRIEVLSVVGFLSSLLCVLPSCGEKTTVLQQKTTEIVTQDFSPEYLDVLWVLDDRSQFFQNKPMLADQAKQFFVRLDGSTASYRMGFITADMLKAKGQLQPLNSPLVLEKNIGDIDQRTALFSSILTQTSINVHTGGQNRGFETAQIALTQYFKPRENVPLVIVFISDSDDHSQVAEGSNAVEYYSKQFLALKANKNSLLRVYSINYVKLENGQSPNPTNRCVTQYSADIDSTNTNADGTPYFQDRFFELAKKLNGDTADLCGTFASKMNLDGLRLKELPKRFTLEKKAQAKTLDVSVYYKGGSQVSGFTWHFEAETNEVVFDATPPQGTNIQFTYLAN